MKKDQRITKLASNLVNYSVDLKKGEFVFIDFIGADGIELVQEVINETIKKGAIPYWNFFDDSLTKTFYQNASEEQHKAFAEFYKAIMERVGAYIGIRASSNPYELSDLSPTASDFKRKYFWDMVHKNIRLKKKWCILRYPTDSMAIMAQKSTESFEDYYFNVCNLDYDKMDKAMDPLVDLMKKTDKVKITAPGTDISFSIKEIPVIKCAGKFNIPDGEVFTAPVKESVNGKIAYNAPSLYDGSIYRNIKLEVKNGKIEKFTCDGNNEKLGEFFNADSGARYFGEFAIGVNPYITTPMGDILFDEKICGSIHLTPGSSYDDASNGNTSVIHWDLVLMQTQESGGGEIYFDNKLIRKDGIFVIDQLKGLNPENLK